MLIDVPLSLSITQNFNHSHSTLRLIALLTTNIPTFGIRIQSLLKNSNIPNTNVHGIYINQDLIFIYQIYPRRTHQSIFTAEIKAIYLALDAIAESEDDYFIIFSDSLSVLLFLKNIKLDNPLVVNLLHKLHLLSKARKTIFFCWIPSHIGIRGNEAADVAAKESLIVNSLIQDLTPS